MPPLPLPVSMPESMPPLLPPLDPPLDPPLLPPLLLPVSVELSMPPLLPPLLLPLSVEPSSVASVPESLPPPVDELLLPPHPVELAATAQPVRALTINHRFKESTFCMSTLPPMALDLSYPGRCAGGRRFRPGRKEHAAFHRPSRAVCARRPGNHAHHTRPPWTT
jgi:hypothetical protein